MISGNGTSTLIHELIHVCMRARSGPGADWIVEGLAEYYSLEILRRSGGISESRYRKAQRQLAEWGKEAPRLDVERSSGPVTARAVGVLVDIDRDIRRSSGGARSLDDVASALAADDGPVTVQRFEELVAQMSAAP
jgi:predicted metalloprotease with PDZ domain